MKKLVLLTLLAVLLMSSLISAAEISSCPTNNCPENNSYCIFYFYGQGCSHCAQTSPVIDSLAGKYQDYTFYKLEIYYNSSNHDLYDDFIKRYGIKTSGIPAVFISSDALIGTDQINNNLENKIIYYLDNTPVCPLNYNSQQVNPHDISPAQKIEITLPAIILAALVDSINPCAFAVLIFLLLYISSLGASRRMLKIGIAYIITVYVVYFLAGLGILTGIQSFGLTRIIFYLAAWISIIAGLINIKDFFWYGKGFSLAIPASKMPLIEKYIARASMPAAIVLGVLVALFELPCTGGVYLAILSLIAKNAYALAIPYLLLYNFIFVLPLIIILLVVYFGVSAEKAEKLRVEKRKWLRLVIGLAMVLLGLAMLLGWFG